MAAIGGCMARGAADAGRPEQGLEIGAVCDRTGLSPRTVRYYE